MFPYLVLSAIGLVPSRTTRVRGLLEKLSTTSTCTAPCRAPCATLPATDTFPICAGSIIPPTHRPKLTAFPFPERDCALFSAHQKLIECCWAFYGRSGGKTVLASMLELHHIVSLGACCCGCGFPSVIHTGVLRPKATLNTIVAPIAMRWDGIPLLASQNWRPRKSPLGALYGTKHLG